MSHSFHVHPSAICSFLVHIHCFCSFLLHYPCFGYFGFIADLSCTFGFGLHFLRISSYVVPHYFMSIATAGMPFPRYFYPHDTIFTYFTLPLLGTVLGMPGL